MTGETGNERRERVLEDLVSRGFESIFGDRRDVVYRRRRGEEVDFAVPLPKIDRRRARLGVKRCGYKEARLAPVYTHTARKIGAGRGRAFRRKKARRLLKTTLARSEAATC